MIPRIIHYCWFGGRPLPKLAEKCMASWRRQMPDVEIRRWDESNFDVESVRYTADAAHAGKWAFVSDYVRLDVVYRYGGVYLDVDVELLKPLDDLLILEAFCGMEHGCKVNTGLAFGAEAGSRIIQELRDEYLKLREFRACPDVQTEVLERFGLRRENVRQSIRGLEVFPTECFDPTDDFGVPSITEAAYSRHFGISSWYPLGWRFMRRSRIVLQRVFGPALIRKMVVLKRKVLPHM